MDKLNDLMWAVAVMALGVLGMVLNFGAPMFWYAAIMFTVGAVWVLLIRIRRAKFGTRN
ncbi:hypothetical protein [Microbacterium sp. NPDC055599]